MNSTTYRLMPPLRFDRQTLLIYGYSLLTGLVSGAVVVAYRGLIGYFEGLRQAFLPQVALSLTKTLLWLALAGVAGWLVSLLVKRSPLIRGSGIPQVKAYLMRRIDFDWKRELPYKFLGGALALGAGLSLGREGPSIQLGALAGFFVAVVRAPITGAVLITEMAGSLAHFPAFIFVSIVATATAELLGTRPIYDTLLSQLVPHNLESEDHSPLHLHIPILEGCPYGSCGALIRHLPEGCLLVSVHRGETSLFPAEALCLQPGDLLIVVVERGRASLLKSRLLALGQGREEA